MKCGNVCCVLSTANQKQTGAWIQSFLLAEVQVWKQRQDLRGRSSKIRTFQGQSGFMFVDTLSHSPLSAHMRSPRNPFPPCTWDATSWKEPKELPFHLHLPLVNQELWWGVGFTKTHVHFTASVVKILPKPQLKVSSLSQTYPVCRNHHSGSHLNILSSRNWLRTIKVLPYFRLSSQTSHD